MVAIKYYPSIGWSGFTTVSAGDILQFSVSGATLLTRILVALTIKVTA
jgi:hypothetical protein